MSIYIWNSEIKNIYVWTTPVKEVYVWTTKVRPAWWQPWANTLLYLPLNSTDTYLDKSWNSISTTNNWVTFWTYQWVDCGSFNGSSNRIDCGNITFTNTTTILAWVYRNPKSWSQFNRIIDFRSSDTNVYQYWYSTNSWYIWYYQRSLDILKHNWYTYTSQWVLTWITVWWWTVHRFIKGNNIDVDNSYSWSNAWFTTTVAKVWANINNNEYWSWGISELIMEKKTWTMDEIAWYYNQTKSKYWIS